MTAVARQVRMRVGDALGVLHLLRDCAAEAGDGAIGGFHIEGAAIWLRLKAEKIAALLEALAAEGVIADGRLQRLDGAEAAAPRRPMTGAERQRRYVAHRRELAADAGMPPPGNDGNDENDEMTSPGVTPSSPSPLLEEEKEIEDSLSFSSDAGARVMASASIAGAGDASGASVPGLRGGYGVEEEEAKKRRAERWLANTLEFARDRMSLSDYRRLHAALLVEPRPKWVQQTLDRLSALRRQELDRALEQDRGPPRQRSLIMPIAGRGGGDMAGHVAADAGRRRGAA